MLSQFGYIGLFLIFGCTFILITLGIPAVLSRLTRIVPRKPTKIKLETYECGMETTGRSWVQFNFRYYIYALMLIVMDVLAVFLYPWASSLGDLGMTGFFIIAFFLIIVTVGYLYAWKKGALEWQ
ncbi:NADH-quinone oxidoreductase subunit A [Dehalogenimonas alkenigignens]|uniref:NADH-quinone oxidoreductase subunit A n=1 Tax=Dehalogenimonas alkenigignens TaxID=1217799 RepID=A0A0W0GJE7_9CHLR|nr:NADH-quinone oxidoreductase subunit A [Dehalogenimonas alkenigignens]KTB48648.1 NADH dehydrogenase subunit A [Dehalogenimonas alkenigignens]PVV84921.1 NADH-quinone oxidoreductase subunit A [Dehalogenimonas alkenigignens]